MAESWLRGGSWCAAAWAAAAAALGPAAASAQPRAPAATAPARGPTSGFYEGRFFLADPRGRFFLAPAGRIHLDTVVPLGEGVTEGEAAGASYRPADARPTMFGARVRTELVAGWLDWITLQLSFEFGVGTAQYAQQYTAASLQNAIVNLQLAPAVNLQLGMFNTPFTIENRTSSNTMEMIERSVTVRSFALPGTKEWGAMLWGEERRHLFYWSVGLFGGDGNRTNADANLMVAGRAFVHPFAWAGGPLAGLQVGGSFLYSKAGASVNYPFQAMRTVGGFTWFAPTAGSGASAVTTVPSGDEVGAAAELMLPLGRFDLRAELVYRDYGIREMAGAANLAGVPLRAGSLRGTSHYVLVGWWVFGPPRLSGSFGYQNPYRVRFDHLDADGPLRRALQLNARWEMTRFTYAGEEYGTSAGQSPRDGEYTMIDVGVAATYWIERYVRFSLAYIHYFFPDPGENRARGPRGEGGPVGSYGEAMARVGLHF